MQPCSPRASRLIKIKAIWVVQDLPLLRWYIDRVHLGRSEIATTPLVFDRVQNGRLTVADNLSTLPMSTTRSVKEPFAPDEKRASQQPHSKLRKARDKSKTDTESEPVVGSNLNGYSTITSESSNSRPQTTGV